MSSRRSNLTLATVLALLVGGCAGTDGPSPGRSASAAPTAQASPASTPLPDGVLAAIALQPGAAPTAIVSGYGSIWVESHRGGKLYRIDPNTNGIVATIDVTQESCGSPGIGGGRVWVMPCGDGSKTMIVDPQTNQVVGSFEGGSVQMAFADGSAWTATPSTRDGTYQRIDPTTFRQVSTSHVGMAPFMSVTADGFIYILDVDPATGISSGSIAKFDPAKGRVVQTIPIPNPGTSPWLLAAFGSLWIKGFDDPRLYKVDPATGNVTTLTIDGFKGLGEFYDIVPVAGFGSIWIRIADDTVARIDPADGKIVGTYPAEPRGGGGYITVAFGSLWVANFSTNTVWRDRIEGTQPSEAPS